MNAKSTFYIKSVNSQFSERRFYRGHKTSDQIVQMLLKKAKNGALIILVNHKSSIPGAIILELGL